MSITLGTGASSAIGSSWRLRMRMRMQQPHVAASAMTQNAHPLLAFQAKQTQVFIERFSKLSTGLTMEKLFDKITTVITGQTTVEPELLEKQFKAITEGEEDTWENLRSDLLHEVYNIWSSSYDLVSNFSPIELGEWITGLFEQFAERFAAWELSTLVALGERWLIWMPIVLIPMAWEMSQRSGVDLETEQRQLASPRSVIQNIEKHDRVRKELERIKWRSMLVEQVESKGNEDSLIEDLVKQLQGLNLTPEEQVTAVHGKWQLVYTSQSQPSGLEMDQLEEEIWHDKQWQDPASDRTLELFTHSSARLRIGAVVLQVSFQGRWQHMAGVLFLKSLKTRIVEVLGAQLPDLGQVVPVPPVIPQLSSVQWKLLYVDDQIRINRANNSQLYIFLKPNC